MYKQKIRVILKSGSDLTLGEIRDQVSGVIGWPIYVWVEGPTGGEIYCTGNYPNETCWRRCGITGGYA